MSLPSPQPHVAALAPYVQGESSVAGVSRIIKLSSNESAVGVSPRALEAHARVAADLHRYPDGSSADLRAAIGQRHGLDPARIVCGVGSDELISLLIRAYSGPGDEIVYSQYGFAMYPIYARGHGAIAVAAPENNLRTDIEAILAAVTEKTKIVFLANPNNPTGTYVPPEDIKRLRAGLREDVLLVLDAAYAEFVDRNDYTDGRDLVDASANTVMLRTFSKIYGLGGARVGWCYAPATIADALNRLRSPFNLAAPSQAAAAAAIRDTEFAALAKAHNDFWLPWLTEKLQGLGLKTTDSVCNFVLICFPSEAGKMAKDADAFLKARGIILRRMDSYGLPDWLRMTVGSDEENRLTIAALAEFLGK